MLTLSQLQAKKVQRKNFSHSEARLIEIKRENKMMVDRLAHVGASQPHTPLPPAPVGHCSQWVTPLNFTCGVSITSLCMDYSCFGLI